jgi:hypothetical protein
MPVIHYTLDGSLPTASSTMYTAPFTIPIHTVVNNTVVVVNARVFGKDPSSGRDLSSFASTASYTLSMSEPTAGFVVTSDSGLKGPYYPVVSLSAVPKQPVTINYSVANGTPSSGSYTFLPGMTHGILSAVTAASGTTTVTITSISGAGRNANQTLRYTIQ